MDRPAKTPKTPGVMRKVIAANLKKLMARDYSALSSVTARQRQLAEDCKIGFGTIQRLTKAEVGGNLETLETLAIFFDLYVYQLTLPNLDVGNPQVVKGADAAEQKFYLSVRKSPRTATASKQAVPETTS